MSTELTPDKSHKRTSEREVCYVVDYEAFLDVHQEVKFIQFINKLIPFSELHFFFLYPVQY
jgi:hypothetical protein